MKPPAVNSIEAPAVNSTTPRDSFKSTPTEHRKRRFFNRILNVIFSMLRICKRRKKT